MLCRGWTGSVRLRNWKNSPQSSFSLLKMLLQPPPRPSSGCGCPCSVTEVGELRARPGIAKEQGMTPALASPSQQTQFSALGTSSCPKIHGSSVVPAPAAPPGLCAWNFLTELGVWALSRCKSPCSGAHPSRTEAILLCFPFLTLHGISRAGNVLPCADGKSQSWSSAVPWQMQGEKAARHL